MAKELQIRNVKIIFSAIAVKLLKPTFKFSGGGATARTLANFLDLMEKEFGSVTSERLVDFCVCAAYVFKNRPQWTVNQIFGKASIKRLKERTKGGKYYEDQWLSSVSLNRSDLVAMIADKSVHPQAKFIYIASEEPTKRRMLNTAVGYIICQTSTLGWSPLSESCSKCKATDDCKQELQKRFPELYRIRIEHGNKTE